MLKEKIQQLANAYQSEAIEIRRHLHMNPELSYEEVETGKFISKTLTALGISHEHGIADNGVVAMIEGKNPTKKIISYKRSERCAL
jgi:metal-dependent amidase/aminoacylase/carboxypeptidase family protein